jgi:hypothetical protein
MAKLPHQEQHTPTVPPQQTGPQQTGVTEADLKQRSQELGSLGKIFGSRDQSPGNIAGLAIIVSFLMLVAIIFSPDSESLPKKDVFTLVGGIITLTLGFLFGRSTS